MQRDYSIIKAYYKFKPRFQYPQLAPNLKDLYNYNMTSMDLPELESNSLNTMEQPNPDKEASPEKPNTLEAKTKELAEEFYHNEEEPRSIEGGMGFEIPDVEALCASFGESPTSNVLVEKQEDGTVYVTIPNNSGDLENIRYSTLNDPDDTFTRRFKVETNNNLQLNFGTHNSEIKLAGDESNTSEGLDGSILVEVTEDGKLNVKIAREDELPPRDITITKYVKDENAPPSKQIARKDLDPGVTTQDGKFYQKYYTTNWGDSLTDEQIEQMMQPNNLDSEIVPGMELPIAILPEKVEEYGISVAAPEYMEALKSNYEVETKHTAVIGEVFDNLEKLQANKARLNRGVREELKNQLTLENEELLSGLNEWSQKLIHTDLQATEGDGNFPPKQFQNYLATLMEKIGYTNKLEALKYEKDDNGLSESLLRYNNVNFAEIGLFPEMGKEESLEEYKTRFALEKQEAAKKAIGELRRKAAITKSEVFGEDEL